MSAAPGRPKQARTAGEAEGTTVSAAPLQVAILVFDDVEALDLGGPYEVFTTASRMAARGSAPLPKRACVPSGYCRSSVPAVLQNPHARAIDAARRDSGIWLRVATVARSLAPPRCGC